MFNFLLACGQNAAASTGGCYDWPVIKQIVIFFGWIIEYIYKFFDMIGIANIGLVIIAFTLLIKLCLLPLTIKQQKFSKLTNIMQPELNAIRVKYTGRKDTESMQAMQDEQKAVYANGRLPADRYSDAGPDRFVRRTSSAAAFDRQTHIPVNEDRYSAQYQWY